MTEFPKPRDFNWSDSDFEGRRVRAKLRIRETGANILNRVVNLASNRKNAHFLTEDADNPDEPLDDWGPVWSDIKDE